MSEPIRAALATAWENSPSFVVTLSSGNRFTSLSLEEAARIISDFLQSLHKNGITAIANGNLPWLSDYLLAAAKEDREP